MILVVVTVGGRDGLVVGAEMAMLDDSVVRDGTDDDEDEDMDKDDELDDVDVETVE
jgi:hypothetical protein